MLGPLDATPAIGPPLTDQQILDAVGATGYYRGRAGSQSLRQRGFDAIFAALRAAVPAANESLRVIETAIQNGQIAPPQAIAYLDELFNQFQGAIGAILKSDSTHCNAACVWSYSLAAIVARKKDRYAHITVKASGARAAADRCNAWLAAGAPVPSQVPDRKSTRLNSSHGSISYAVFCLKKKKKTHELK